MKRDRLQAEAIPMKYDANRIKQSTVDDLVRVLLQGAVDGDMRRAAEFTDRIVAEAAVPVTVDDVAALARAALKRLGSQEFGDTGGRAFATDVLRKIVEAAG